MKIKEGVIISGLHILMRPVLRQAEVVWKEFGQSDGVTVTGGLDGVHSAASWHYYGLALDFRTHCFTSTQKKAVHNRSRNKSTTT